MVFPVVMYGCESWTIKKAERRRIDAFELWCWRRLSGVPWTARRSNQSILKEIIWKDPDAGKDWGQEEKGTTEDEMVGWHHWLDGHGFGWTLGVGDGQGGLACCNSWGRKDLDMTEQLNWTELNWALSGRDYVLFIFGSPAFSWTELSIEWALSTEAIDCIRWSQRFF